MTDKEKIRKEVERLRSLHQMKYQQLDTDNSMSLVECGKRNLCNELLSFIDSLQEEPNDDWKYSIAEKLGISREEYDKIDYNKDYGKEEPVSEDLKEAALMHFKDVMQYEIKTGHKMAHMTSFKAGAEWQKKQDQSTIELAEDHAMLAGMEKMKEEMMAKAVDATIGLPYENKDGGYTHLIDVSRPLPVGNNKIAIIFKED